MAGGTLYLRHHAFLVRVQMALQHEHVVAHLAGLVDSGTDLSLVMYGGGSGTRVVVVQRLAQSGPHDVRVNLGGRDIGVPQHSLHAAQVGAAFEEMRGETMPQHVWRQIAKNAHPPAMSL